MLGKSKVMTFLATSNPGRTVRFYRDKLGLRLVKIEKPFAIVLDANGTMLRIQTGTKPVVPRYTALGWEVKDIVAMVKKLRKAGVKTLRFPGMPQDKSGIWSPDGTTRVAWFQDPEGYILSLTQF